MEVQLHASGATAEKAVEQLKARRKTAIAKLKELKAEEGSIRVANTVIMRTFNSEFAPGSPGEGIVPGPTGGDLLPLVPTPAGGGFVPAPGATVPPPATPPATEPVPPILPIHFACSVAAPGDSPRPAIELAPAASTAPLTAPPATTSAPPSVAIPTLPVPPPAGFTVPPAGFATPWVPSSPLSIPLDAATTLRAEWRLTTSDPDGMALAGESLREKLAAARVFGDDNPWCLDAYSVPSFTYRSPGQAAPTYARVVKNGFTLSFVGALSDTDRKMALAAAMTAARRNADELAEIAGGRIGDLCSLSNCVSNGSTFEPPVISSSVPSRIPSFVRIPVPQANQSEVVSQSPDLPEFSVQVFLNYRLLNKNPVNP
jgi:uncharacterized protein YggE